MQKPIEERLIELFPSQSLRSAIKSSGYRLSGMQLITAAYQYAPDYYTRLALLEELIPGLDGELHAYCERLVEGQKSNLAEFTKACPGTVFELMIKTDPDAYEERYLASSYEAALALIPKFYEEYECDETDSARYEITKRRVLDGSEFSEDELGSMELLKGGRILSVDLEGRYREAEGCDGLCNNCENGCAKYAVFHFPVFVRTGDAVSFTEYSGKKRFGIIGGTADDECDYAYVLPLDSSVILCRDFENLFDCHEHIPVPLVERIEANELPDEYRESYIAVKNYLDSMDTPNRSVHIAKFVLQ